MVFKPPKEDRAVALAKPWKVLRKKAELPAKHRADFLSRQPSAIKLEIRGALITYNLAYQEMAEAALAAKVEPTNLSFLLALRILLNEMIWAIGMASGKLPAHLLHLSIQLQFASVENRQGASMPDAIKQLPKRDAVKYPKKIIWTALPPRPVLLNTP